MAAAAAPAGGDGVQEGVGESSSPPRGPAPATAPSASGGSGGGGGGLRDVCLEVFKRLVADGHAEALVPNLRARLEAHFARLPTRYQLYVNVDKAEEVLFHEKVLAEAKDHDKRPAFAIRFLRLEEMNAEVRTNSDAYEEGAATDEAFSARPVPSHRHIHEIVLSTTDKPNLLNQLRDLLSDTGLNIRETRVFSTTDGYSLDVFVVDGWDTEDTDGLHKVLEESIQRKEVFSDIAEPQDIHAQAQGAVGESSLRQKTKVMAMKWLATVQYGWRKVRAFRAYLEQAPAAARLIGAMIDLGAPVPVTPLLLASADAATQIGDTLNLADQLFASGADSVSKLQKVVGVAKSLGLVVATPEEAEEAIEVWHGLSKIEGFKVRVADGLSPGMKKTIVDVFIVRGALDLIV